MKTKSIFLMAIITMLVITGCGSSQGRVEQNNQNQIEETQQSQVEETRYYYWVCQQGEHAGAEIVFARMNDVFRGEYVDPGFQDRVSIPVMGTIDNEGNITGISMGILPEGDIQGMLNGKITGDTFSCTWLPTPTAMWTSMFREMEMTLKTHSPEMQKEVDKYPNAFYNTLFPELEYYSSYDEKQSRIIPIMPEQTTVGGIYGYAIGEWENKNIYLAEINKGEVELIIHFEESGQFDVNIDISGVAKLNGNTFRYNENGYEFEVVIYNDFIVIKTISGALDTEVKLDGVYPSQRDMFHYR